MKHIVLPACLLVTAVSCMAESEPLVGSSEGAVLACTDTCAVPPLVRWTETTGQLWRRDVEYAVVVLHDSSLEGHFRAYGVDVGTDNIEFVFDVRDADFESFMAQNMGEWIAIDSSPSSRISYGVLGSIKNPPPPPPPLDPIGTPNIKAIKQAAYGAIAHTKAMAY